MHFATLKLESTNELLGTCYFQEHIENQVLNFYEHQDKQSSKQPWNYLIQNTGHAAQMGYFFQPEMPARGFVFRSTFLEVACIIQELVHR